MPSNVLDLIIDAESGSLYRDFGGRTTATLANLAPWASGRVYEVNLFLVSKDQTGILGSVDVSTDTTLKIGRVEPPAGVGFVTFTFGESVTIPRDELTAARIGQELNGLDTMKAAGGITIEGSGSDFVGVFNTVGDKDAIGLVPDLAPTSSAIIDVIEAGTASTREKVAIRLVEDSCASVTSWAAISDAVATVTVIQDGAALHHVETIEITGNPAGGSFTYSHTVDSGIPISVDSTAGELEALLETKSVEKVGAFKWRITWAATGTATTGTTDASGVEQFEGITGTLSLTNAQLYAVLGGESKSLLLDVGEDDGDAYLSESIQVSPALGDVGSSLPTSSEVIRESQRDVADGFAGLNSSGELSSDLAIWDTIERRRGTVSEVVKEIDHVWTCNETGGDFWDAGAASTPMHLTDTNTVGAAAQLSEGYTARTFTSTNEEYGDGAALGNGSGAFSFAAGLTFASAVGTRAIAGSADSGAVSWIVYRTGGDVAISITRESGSGTHSVVASGAVDAGNYQVVSAVFDGTSLILRVDGEEWTANAFLGLNDSGADFKLGRAYVSSDLTRNYHDGTIAWAAAHNGIIGEDELEVLRTSTPSDWGLALKRRLGISAWGDSLTSGTYANPDWPYTLAGALRGWASETNGIGGESSTGTAARVAAYDQRRLERGVVAIWSGNNNSSNTDDVIADVTAMRLAAITAGARCVMLVGLPNRTPYTSSDADIQTAQDNLDIINAAQSALAVANPGNTIYYDLHDFCINNYTAVDADDTADMARGTAGAGIVPRSMRYTDTNTHYGQTGIDAFTGDSGLSDPGGGVESDMVTKITEFFA